MGSIQISNGSAVGHQRSMSRVGLHLSRDFSCWHLNHAVLNPGVVANDVESGKSSKYLSLVAQFRFVPFVVETLGAPGDEAFAFLGIVDSA